MRRRVGCLQLRVMLVICRDRRDDVLRFTTDTSIWPTNNISERGVRPTSRRFLLVAFQMSLRGPS